MKWDFSLVQAQGEVKEIAAALHQHLNDCIGDFARRYRERLPAPIEIHPDNALSSWRSVLTAVSETPHKRYLLIDEYDNFANEMLIADRAGNRDRYEALAGLTSFNECILRIPNLVARGLYDERLRESWLPPCGVAQALPAAVRRLGQQGDL